MNALDYFVLIAYLVGVTAIGLSVSSIKKPSLDQYFMAGRTVPWVAAAASLVATGISCKSLVGLPGLSYKGDMTYLQMYLPVPLALIITSQVFLPFYSRLRFTSVYEYLGLRFNARVRSFASLLFQLEAALIAGTVIAAPSVVLSEVAGVSYEFSVVVLLFLTLLYTVVGGTKAVIWTDVMQLGVFVGVPIAVVYYMVSHSDGGIVNLVKVAGEHGKLRLLDFSFDLGTEMTFWSALLSMTCWHLANFSVSQFLMQRYMTAESEKDCKRTLLVGGMGILVMWAGLMSIGVLLFAYNVMHPGSIADNVAVDRVFPTFILSALPAGFKGLFIAAAFAAGMSTLSSILNSMGTVTLLDVWKLHFDDHVAEGKWITRARWLTVGWGVVSFGAAFVVLKFGTVVTAGIRLGTVIIGAVFGMFLLGAFSKRATPLGTSIGAVTGMAVLTIMIAGQSRVSWTWYCLIGTLITVVVGYLASLFSPAPQGIEAYTYAGIAPASTAPRERAS